LKVGFKIPYRTVQGIVRGLSEYIRIEEMHFTHIRRRILKIKPSVVNLNLGNDDDDDDDKPVTLIVDASGLTVSKKGDYIENVCLSALSIHHPLIFLLFLILLLSLQWSYNFLSECKYVFVRIYLFYEHCIIV
jgi:hypothetical protein